jgi:hypothetical protein
MQNDSVVRSPAEPGHGVSAYVFLGLILLLLAGNVIFLALFSHGRSDYGNLVICIMLLLNHIAFQFAKRGRLSVIMKTIAGV